MKKFINIESQTYTNQSLYKTKKRVPERGALQGKEGKERRAFLMIQESLNQTQVEGCHQIGEIFRVLKNLACLSPLPSSRCRLAVLQRDSWLQRHEREEFSKSHPNSQFPQCT